jgi:hypothetical protein
VIAGVLTPRCCAQAKQRTTANEQTQFSADVDEGVSPVEELAVIPPEALIALAKDEGVASCLASSELPPEQLPAAWFIASIHLSSRGETDLVVLPNVAGNPRNWSGCFSGANTSQFWILRKNTRGYRLALSVWTTGLNILSGRGTRLYAHHHLILNSTVVIIRNTLN